MAGLRGWGTQSSLAAVVIVALGSQSVQAMSAPVWQGPEKPISEGADRPASPPEPGADREEATRESAARDAELRKRVALAAFTEARRLFLLEQFMAAARQFRRSYNTLPSLEALLAAARAFDRAGAIFEAIESYEEYLEFEDEDVARHAKAVQRLGELRARLGKVQLRLAEPERISELVLNGEVVTAEDFPRSVLPGKVSLVVRHVGVEAPLVLDSSVGSGEVTVLEVPARSPDPPRSLKPEGPAPSPRVITEPPAAIDRRTLRAVFATGGGLTGATAIAIAVLGGLTVKQKRVYRDGLCTQTDGACVAGSTYPYEAEESFIRLRRATNVTIGVGIALAVTTVVVATIVHKRRKPSAPEAAGMRDRRLRFAF